MGGKKPVMLVAADAAANSARRSRRKKNEDDVLVKAKGILDDTITTVTNTAISILDDEADYDDYSIDDDSVTSQDESISETFESRTSQDEQHSNAEERAETTRLEKEEARRNKGKFKMVKKGRSAAKRLVKQLTKKDCQTRQKKPPRSMGKAESEEDSTWFYDLADKFGCLCGTYNAGNDDAYYDDDDTASYDSFDTSEDGSIIPTFEL